MTEKRPSNGRSRSGHPSGLGYLFRERQVIIHDGAHVRRFTVRRWHQIGVFAVLATFAGWGIAATAAFFDGRAQVAERNGEITRRVAELDGIKASYRAAFDRLDEFQSLFANITCEISDIQNSLLRVAERNVAPDRRSLVTRQPTTAKGAGCGPGVASVAVAAPSVVASTMTEPPVRGGELATVQGLETPRIVGTLHTDEQDAVRLRVSQLSAALERLRQTHGAFLKQSADIAAKRVGVLEKALSRVGVDAAQLGNGGASERIEGVPSAFGTGGPFVPLPKTNAPGGDFDPVALFNSHADRLDSLILAMRTLPLSQPLEESEVTSPFGARDDPFNEQTAFHEGVDFGAPLNSPVAATGDGVIIWAGWRDKYGIMVEIDHGHGLTTRYAHLGRTLVHVGDKVVRGRPIGLLGNTGRSTGPHLHYEVRVNDQPTDPLKFITAGRDVLKNE